MSMSAHGTCSREFTCKSLCRVYKVVIYCSLLGVRLLWGPSKPELHSSHPRLELQELRQPLRCVLLLALSSFLAHLMLPWTKSGAQCWHRAKTHHIWPNACPDPRSTTPITVSVFFLAHGSMTGEVYLPHPSSNLRRQAGKLDPA